MNTIYEIFTTADGSHSVLVSDSGYSFHSKNGAIQESMHVFINSGLQHFIDTKPAAKKIAVFEVGFGTGLNALLTAISAQKNGKTIEYHTIDAYPLTIDLFSKLNYPQILQEPELYKTIMQTGWGQLVYVGPFFKLKKMETNFSTYEFSSSYDIIYFDAFGPDDQPEMWQLHNFKKMFNALNAGGVLVTYSSKSMVRKNLEAAGFTIEKLEGPPGKREIVRAIKT